MSKKNIHQLWKTDVPDGHVDKPWTNNNSESINHVFNMSILWESKPLLDLVQIIEDIMSTQYKDPLRPIVIIGQYRLADTHKHFYEEERVHQLENLIWIMFNYLPDGSTVPPYIILNTAQQSESNT